MTDWRHAASLTTFATPGQALLALLQLITVSLALVWVFGPATSRERRHHEEPRSSRESVAMVRTLSRTCGRAALLLALVGCVGDGPRVELRITHYEHVSSASAGPHLERESVAVKGGVRQIQVDGTITLPDHCDVLRVGLELDPPEVELRLRARKNNEPDEQCDQSDRSVIVQYVARIGSLPAAQYGFRIVYDSHSAHARPPGGGDPAIERTLYQGNVVVR